MKLRSRNALHYVALSVIVGTYLVDVSLYGQTSQPVNTQGSSEDQTKDLAKAVQNPAASLISVPFQNNTNLDIGPNDRTQNVLNIQPVIPVRLSANWNLIMRVITPIIYQPSIPSLIFESNPAFNHLGTLGLEI